MNAVSLVFRKPNLRVMALFLLSIGMTFFPSTLHSQSAGNSGQIVGLVVDPTLDHFSSSCIPRMSFRAERGICFLRSFGCVIYRTADPSLRSG